MDVAVETFKIVAAMSNHRSRKRGHRLRRDLDRAGCEKLVVRDHELASADFADLRRVFLAGDETDVTDASGECMSIFAALATGRVRPVADLRGKVSRGIRARSREPNRPRKIDNHHADSSAIFRRRS